MPADLLPATLHEQIAEIERELGQRARVYPRLIASKKLSPDAADRQNRRLQAAAATLRRLQQTERQEP